MKRTHRIAILLGFTLSAACQNAPGGEHASAQADRARPPASDVASEASEAGEEQRREDPNVIVVSPEAASTNHFELVEASRGSGSVTVRVPGRLELDQNATAQVHSPLEGRLADWLVNVGDRVKKGDVLGRVESPQNLGNTVAIRATLSGEIIERAASLGAWVKPEDALAVVGDLSRLWVVAEVREDLLEKVRIGQPASVRLLSYPGRSFQAKFLRSRAEVEKETRTVEFLFELPNTERKFRAGMFAYVSLASGEEIRQAVLVADEAVQTVHDRPVVFVRIGDDRYRMTPITLGRKIGELYEVVDGLHGGEQVVRTGSFVLKSEALRSEFAEED